MMALCSCCEAKRHEAGISLPSSPATGVRVMCGDRRSRLCLAMRRNPALCRRVVRHRRSPPALRSARRGGTCHGLAVGTIAAAAFAPARLRPAITGAITDEQWRVRRRRRSRRGVWSVQRDSSRRSVVRCAASCRSGRRSSADRGAHACRSARPGLQRDDEAGGRPRPARPRRYRRRRGQQLPDRCGQARSADLPRRRRAARGHARPAPVRRRDRAANVDTVRSALGHDQRTSDRSVQGLHDVLMSLPMPADRSNRLSTSDLRPSRSPRSESNRRPDAYKASALAN